MILTSFLAILLLCLTHIFVTKLKLAGIPRSKWLSIAGGISVTYIFLNAFPELKDYQMHLNTKTLSLPGFEEMEIYFIGLLGLTFFYGLESKTRKSKQSGRDLESGKEKKDLKVFWVHLCSFAIYNFIIGYLLLNREESSILSMLVYATAMSFHLLVTDHSIESHFGKSYKEKGRWILVLALVMGWLLSLFLNIPKLYVGFIFSFIAGGVIMNVLKEELPKDSDSNLWAFCAGVLFYSGILILV